MTVSNLVDKVTYTGTNTVGQTMAITFEFDADVDISVVETVTATDVETVKAFTTDFTLSGGAGGTGTLTTVAAVPDARTWTIYRRTPLTQPTDYIDNDAFPAESHETALDRLTRITQNLQEQLNRCLKFPVSEATSVSAELAEATARIDQILGFNSTGGLVVADLTTSGSLTTAYTQTLLDDANAAAARATLAAQEDVITTRGDIVRGSSGAVAERLAKGASGEVLTADANDALWVNPNTLTAAFPRGHLAGLQITRTSSTLFDAAVGECRAGSSSDPNLGNFINTTAAFGKTFVTGGWVAGDGNSGVPTAAGFAVSIDTWHYFALLGTDGSVEFGYDTSVSAANLVADSAVQAALTATVYFRRLGSLVSTATPNFADFIQHGDRFLWDVAVQDVNLTTPTTGILTHTLPSVPDGIRVEALVSIYILEDAAGFYKFAHGDASTVATPTDTDKDAETVGTASYPGVNWSGSLLTNTSQQIKSRSSSDPTQLDIQVRGWVDHRGRDD